MQKNSSLIINKGINKKTSSSEDEKEEKDLLFLREEKGIKNSRWNLIPSGVFDAYSSNE